MSYALSESVVCVSYFQAKKEHQKELIAALLKLIEPTRAEPGCLQYELIIDKEDSNFLIMLEKFVSLEALAKHEEQPYIQEFVEKFMSQYCEKVTWNVGKEILRESLK